MNPIHFGVHNQTKAVRPESQPVFFGQKPVSDQVQIRFGSVAEATGEVLELTSNRTLHARTYGKVTAPGKELTLQGTTITDAPVEAMVVNLSPYQGHTGNLQQGVIARTLTIQASEQQTPVVSENIQVNALNLKGGLFTNDNLPDERGLQAGAINVEDAQVEGLLQLASQVDDHEIDVNAQSFRRPEWVLDVEGSTVTGTLATPDSTFHNGYKLRIQNSEFHAGNQYREGQGLFSSNIEINNSHIYNDFLGASGKVSLSKTTLKNAEGNKPGEVRGAQISISGGSTGDVTLTGDPGSSDVKREDISLRAHSAEIGNIALESGANKVVLTDTTAGAISLDTSVHWSAYQSWESRDPIQVTLTKSTVDSISTPQFSNRGPNVITLESGTHVKGDIIFSEQYAGGKFAHLYIAKDVQIDGEIKGNVRVFREEERETIPYIT